MVTQQQASDLLQFYKDQNLHIWPIDPTTKGPLNGKGWKTRSWDVSKKDLHKIKKRIGFRTGLQPDGRFIIVLDYDMYDAKTDSIRSETKAIYDEATSHTKDGLFLSGTCGNRGQLIDISNHPDMIEFIKKDGRIKMNYKNVEILCGFNCVLPPTKTICKSHDKRCRDRIFTKDKGHAENPSIASNISNEFANFIMDLLNKATKKTNKTSTDIPTKTKDKPTKTGDKSTPKPIPTVSIIRLSKIVNSLKPKRADDYNNSWYPVVQCIYNIATEQNYIKDGIDLIHTFSEHSTKYDFDKVNQFIKNNLKYEEGFPNLQTLKRMAESDNLSVYEKHKQEFELNHFKVLYPSPKYIVVKEVKTEEDSEIMHYDTSEDSLKQMYRHIHGGEFIKTWIKDENIRRYDHCVFEPNTTIASKTDYNIWTGLLASKYPQVDEEVNLSPLFDLMTDLTGGADNLNSFLDILAYRVQFPWKRLGKLLVFKSVQGVGKNYLWSYIANYILGPAYYHCTSDAEELFGRFPTSLRGKLLIVLDEVSGKDTFRYHDKLKNLITEDKVPHEPKGVSRQYFKNYCMFVFLSNNNTPVKVETTDRRVIAYECKPTQFDPFNNAQRTAYFNFMDSVIKTDKFCRKFYDFLMARDLSKFYPSNLHIDNEFYRDLRSVNVPLVARYLIARYIDNNDDEDVEELDIEPEDNNQPEAPITVLSSLMYNDFTEWAKQNGYKSEYNSSSFGLAVKKFNTIKKNRSKRGVTMTFNITDLETEMKSLRYIDDGMFDKANQEDQDYATQYSNKYN